MKTVFVSLVLATVCLSAVFAIKCYQCDSTSDPRCEDEFSAEVSLQTDNCFRCTKMKGKMGGLEMVQRACDTNSTSAMGFTGCHEMELFGIEMEVCVCEEELCNHGNRAGINLLMAVIVGMLMFMINFRF